MGSTTRREPRSPPTEMQSMDHITIENYRCFHDVQSARLAPLTLLVGENSTGKTSFLAMIRALADIASGSTVPYFKEEPYDLGSYEEIAHHRGARGGRAEQFKAGFRTMEGRKAVTVEVTFEKRDTVPFPVVRKLSNGRVSLEATQADNRLEAILSTSRGTWKERVDVNFPSSVERHLVPLFLLTLESPRGSKTINGSQRISGKDRSAVSKLIRDADCFLDRPYASGPVRSKPKRTYDPTRPARDPEGDYVPMYLASLYAQGKGGWNKLKEQLEAFGRSSGLFDEISIKPLGSGEGAPFQVQIRRYDGRLKGPRRNLLDVGYGVSQALPLITELLRRDASSMFLLQQPEVHLHPSAQAALGTLFCSIASDDRRLIVETHSDYIIDRVRMEVRDARESVGIQPSDVSILFFERGELDVKIHSIRIDSQGNVRDAPESYGRFFMEETRRSIGI